MRCVFLTSQLSGYLLLSKYLFHGSSRDGGIAKEFKTFRVLITRTIGIEFVAVQEGSAPVHVTLKALLAAFCAFALHKRAL